MLVSYKRREWVWDYFQKVEFVAFVEAISEISKLQMDLCAKTVE